MPAWDPVTYSTRSRSATEPTSATLVRTPSCVRYPVPGVWSQNTIRTISSWPSGSSMSHTSSKDTVSFSPQASVVGPDTVGECASGSTAGAPE